MVRQPDFIKSYKKKCQAVTWTVCIVYSFIALQNTNKVKIYVIDVFTIQIYPDVKKILKYFISTLKHESVEN